MLENITSMIPSTLLNGKIVFIIIVALGYLFYSKFFGRKPYCYVRIKEKRGNMFVDHGKTYPCFIHRMKSEEGRIIKWLYVDKINKIWKVPRNTDFTPNTTKNKLLELAWFGRNTFQIIRTDNFMYEKIKEKNSYKKVKANEVNLRVVPEDLKYLDFELDTKIDSLTSNKNWFDKYLKPYMTYIIVGVICLLMLYTTTKQITENTAKVMGEATEKMDSLGQRFANYVVNYNGEKVDDNTIISSNPNKKGD